MVFRFPSPGRSTECSSLTIEFHLTLDRVHHSIPTRVGLRDIARSSSAGPHGLSGRPVLAGGVEIFVFLNTPMGMLKTITVLLAIATARAFAQPPIQVDVYKHDGTTPAERFAGMMADQMNQATTSFLAGAQIGLERQRLDLERQRFEWEKEQARESARLKDRVLDPNFHYRDVRPQEAEWRVNQDVMDAFNRARREHPDFDALQPIMRVVAEALRPDWTRVTMTEYIECLYAIAKAADFAEPVRKKLASVQTAPAKQ